ncbi:hypothetical protein OF829_16580 [Sphingomonas sp. LB-2]|uniref:hypothetical protein n=1 Tax=Sphingomonas caeni TaxID=2984949 RepID=UPI00222F07A8|nr:hypothetical protein [Sphingomonas caeni]MCW3848854.1 hypothetical protein [Sphingomonas caeni]
MTALYAANRGAESLFGVSADAGVDRMTHWQAGARRAERGDQLSAHWRGLANPPEVAAFLVSAWHARSGRGARRRLAHSMRAHAAAPDARIREFVFAGLC